MSTAQTDDRRTGRTLAIAGGGALLLWWLLRGDGGGLGGSGGAGALASPPAAPRAPCRVRIDDTGISVDGAPVDVAGAVTACRGRVAELLATGAARQGTVDDVVRALGDAGVEIITVRPSSSPRNTRGAGPLVVGSLAAAAFAAPERAR